MAQSFRKRITGSAPVQNTITAFYDGIGALHSRGYNIDDTVIVSASPRSGTTWVMEVLEGASGYPSLDEPLKVNGRKRMSKQFSLDWRTYKPVDQDDPKFDEMMRIVLSGQQLTLGETHQSAGNLLRLVRGTPLIVKEVRLNLCLPYVHKHFPRNKIVEILRNPYAVIASQLGVKGGAWGKVTAVGEFYKPVLADNPELAWPEGATHPDEILAIHWALEHAYLRKNIDYLQGVHFVRYEDLYHQPEVKLREVLQFIGIGWKSEYLALLPKKSWSTQSTSALHENKDPTTNYRRTLSEEQRRRIEAVLKWYDFPFYGADEY